MIVTFRYGTEARTAHAASERFEWTLYPNRCKLTAVAADHGPCARTMGSPGRRPGDPRAAPTTTICGPAAMAHDAALRQLGNRLVGILHG